VVDAPRLGADKDGAVADDTPARRLADATARYQTLVSELATIGVVTHGSLALRTHRCGKSNCACMADPPRPHGPYWHLTTKVAGKTVNRRLSEAEALAYREGIDNDRKLRALVDELHQVGEEVIELTLAERVAAGSRV
jgi:hypothetical protein